MFRTNDGREFQDAKIVLKPEAMARLRLGYQCAYCFERFESPYPKSCRVCNFPVSDLQPEYIARRFVGPEHVGSRVSKSDEFERMREMHDYENRTGIALPDSVKYPSSVKIDG